MQIERPTSRVTHAVSFRRGAILAIAALASAALVSACGSSKGSSEGTATTNVDTARVAASIEGTLLAKRHITAKVACPAEVKAVKGATFECIATSSATKGHPATKTPFVVTVQSSRGYVTYVGK